MFRDFQLKPYPMFREFSQKSDLLERHTPVLPYTASTPPPPPPGCDINIKHASLIIIINNNFVRIMFNFEQSSSFEGKLILLTNCAVTIPGDSVACSAIFAMAPHPARVSIVTIRARSSARIRASQRFTEALSGLMIAHTAQVTLTSLRTVPPKGLFYTK